LQSQSDKQFLRRAGVFEAKSNTLFGVTYIRFIWLFINLLTGIFASFFISLFEDSIAKVTVLAVLMPITASMGGNCGTQTSTVIIRAIFVGDINKKQAIMECLVALFNGIALGFVCMISVWFFYSNFLLGMCFGLSILITLIAAGLSGVLIPIGLKKINIDPAVASTVFLTTVTDVIGFFTFLALGTIFLM
jgi:magnesium transporter